MSEPTTTEIMAALHERTSVILDAGFEFKSESEQRDADILHALLDFKDATEHRFNHVDARLTVHDRRFDSMQSDMDRRFDRVDQRFDAVDRRFDAVDARFDVVEADVKEIKAQLALTDACVSELRREVRGKRKRD